MKEKKILLRLEDLYISSMEVLLINGLSLTVNSNEIVAIVGESGSGKSLTALAIAGLLRQTPLSVSSKKMQLSGRELSNLSHKDWQTIRGKEFGMIFQEPQSSLNPSMRCGPQVMERLQQNKIGKPQDYHNKVLEAFQQVQLPQPKRIFKAYPHELSGGMCQRVMIAMALACEPALLIADEPTTALDVTIQVQILHLLRQLQKQHGMALLFISHDLRVIAEMADRVAIMYAGDIIEETSVRAIFERPRHPYTRGLLKSRPSLTEISGQRERLYHIPGNVPSLQELSEGCRFLDRCPWPGPDCSVKIPELLGFSHRSRCYRWFEFPPDT